MHPVLSSTQLTITNPLIKYRAFLATNKIRPDPAQHRLAVQLQKLYYRLKDYSPELEYRDRLEQITRSAGLVSRSRPPRPALLSSIWRNRPREGARALIRTTTIQESALSINSPQGMLLYGEVGRGKSMLLDLFASSLPSGKKKRWHFNTFMLDTFHRLEKLRMQRSRLPPESQGFEEEHSVLSLAKDTIDTSPILFLDEFQLPDRAASKLLNSFFTSFFHLGGVLIASSNRMPDELAKAAGVEYAPQPSGRNSVFAWQTKRSAADKAATTDFGAFLELLKARCEIWEIEGDRDWRRDDKTEQQSEAVFEGAHPLTSYTEAKALTPDGTLLQKHTSSPNYPQQYHISSPPSSSTNSATGQVEWDSKICSLLDEPSSAVTSQKWTPATLSVYGRQVFVPAATSTGCTLWSFSDLCAANLGPADYVSLASTYHTLILDSVPVLHLIQKNEARRFITLLDALYESRCRLLMRAAAPPDQIFFPEIRTTEAEPEDRSRSGDEVYQETLAEIYQDSTSPFRPNISSYDQTRKDSSASPTRSLLSPSLRSVLADEDADFGPVYGTGEAWRQSQHQEQQQQQQQQQQAGSTASTAPDFTKTAALTGEDERFAFKRARSRIWEMCGQRWWDQRPDDQVEQWWRPVAAETRFWEMGKKQSNKTDLDSPADDLENPSAVTLDDSRQTNTNTNTNTNDPFRHGATSPFRTSPDPPPKFGWQHAWGMISWGRKAGEWGKGVDGVGRKGLDRGSG